MLGGRQTGSFRVRGDNLGPSAVEVLAKSSSGEHLITTAVSGQPIEHRFGPGEVALFRNTSQRETISVRIDITSEVEGLGMRYMSTQNQAEH